MCSRQQHRERRQEIEQGVVEGAIEQDGIENQRIVCAQNGLIGRESEHFHRQIPGHHAYRPGAVPVGLSHEGLVNGGDFVQQALTAGVVYGIHDPRHQGGVARIAPRRRAEQCDGFKHAAFPSSIRAYYGNMWPRGYK